VGLLTWGGCVAAASKTAAAEVGSKKSNVRRFENGFEVHELSMGLPNGKLAKAGKRVKVKYVGRLKSNGKVFDKTNSKPFMFRLGTCRPPPCHAAFLARQLHGLDAACALLVLNKAVRSSQGLTSCIVWWTLWVYLRNTSVFSCRGAGPGDLHACEQEACFCWSVGARP
jgi:hypothetical protein